MTEIKPKVSVCVVTYNQEKYIRQCLQSIVDQKTDFDFEVIVCDDCSTDGTSAIVQAFADRYPDLVKPISHATNIGPYRNYFFVHHQAIGEYIAHVDGDDYWLPGKLSTQVVFMENNKMCVAVYTNALVIGHDNRVIGVFGRNIKETFDTNYLIRDGNFLCHSSMMYKASIRDKAFSMSGDFIDYHVHIKLSENGLLGHIDKNLVAYRSDSSSSIRKTVGNYIGHLYFKAILDVDLSKVKLTSLHDAFAEFLANTMAYELVYGTFSSYRKWLSMIKTSAPINIYMLQASACPLFLKKVFKKIFYRLRRIAFGNNAEIIIFEK